MDIFGKQKLNMKVREDFPILNSQLSSQKKNTTAKKEKLIYFDNACVTLRPQVVIDAISSYYTNYSSCAGRSNHRLSRELDIALISAREVVSKFIGAKHSDEIIFTKNATEAMNLVANAFPFESGDVVLGSDKEHNSNLVPWLKLSKTKGIIYKVVESGADGEFSLKNLEKEFAAAKKNKQKVKLVSIHHISNVDGTQIDVAAVTKLAHSYGALVLVDGCQAAGHIPLDVKKLGVDFYAFSAHKMCGPSGMGALYASRDAQNKFTEFNQFIVGGQTVKRTTHDSYMPLVGPAKFEAGLQDYAGIIGFAAACKYISHVGVEKIEKHSLALNELLTELLSNEIDSGKIKLLGPRDAKKRSSIFSFVVPNISQASQTVQTEFASLLDKSYGIAVRAGQHCVHSWFNMSKNSAIANGSVRISLYFYNTEDEIKETAQAIRALLKLQSGEN